MLKTRHAADDRRPEAHLGFRNTTQHKHEKQTALLLGLLLARHSDRRSDLPGRFCCTNSAASRCDAIIVRIGAIGVIANDSLQHLGFFREVWIFFAVMIAWQRWRCKHLIIPAQDHTLRAIVRNDLYGWHNQSFFCWRTQHFRACILDSIFQVFFSLAPPLAISVRRMRRRHGDRKRLRAIVLSTPRGNSHHTTLYACFRVC